MTTQTGAIASALMIVARYHCKLDERVIGRFRTMAADVTPGRQTEVSDKNLDLLRQFDNPITLAKLLHLPAFLMDEAEKLKDRPFEAARTARAAAAIEILLHVPLRIKNLAELRLGQHLKFADMRSGRISHLSLQAHEIKTKRSVEWSVGRDLDGLLQRYLRKFRPLLAPNGSDFLFPAGFGHAGPQSVTSAAASLKSIIADRISVLMNPHLFRSLAAKLVLEDNSGALEDVRQLLGDKTLAIVLAHYAAMEPGMAARRHDTLLQKLRGQLPSHPTEPRVSAARGGIR